MAQLAQPIVTADGATSSVKVGSVTLTRAVRLTYLWNTARRRSRSPSRRAAHTTSRSPTAPAAHAADTIVTVNPTPAVPSIRWADIVLRRRLDHAQRAPAGFSYLWNTGATTQSITVSAGGAYSVTVSNGSCSSPSADHVVTMNPSRCALDQWSDLFCEGSSITRHRSGWLLIRLEHRRDDAVDHRQCG